jgi:outer membrane protein assembly factor BamD
MPLAPLKRVFAVTLLSAGLLATAGCGMFGKERRDEKLAKDSAEQVYRDAQRDLRVGNYPSAIQRYEWLEARYPFSEQARQGSLDLMYAYYKAGASDSAVDQAEEFIRENPTHPRVDYAYYVRGLVYFESGLNWLERRFNVDMAKRPPTEARKSFQAFQTLVLQYPRSPYAADARQRMVYLRNRLAEYEVAVGRYYLRRGAYVGAANRARGVLENYDGSSATPEALRILEEAYRRLGVDDLAALAAEVRKANALPDEAGQERKRGSRWRFWN